MSVVHRGTVVYPGWVGRRHIPGWCIPLIYQGSIYQGVLLLPGYTRRCTPPTRVYHRVYTSHNPRVYHRVYASHNPRVYHRVYLSAYWCTIGCTSPPIGVPQGVYRTQAIPQGVYRTQAIPQGVLCCSSYLRVYYAAVHTSTFGRMLSVLTRGMEECVPFSPRGMGECAPF